MKKTWNLEDFYSNESIQEHIEEIHKMVAELEVDFSEDLKESFIKRLGEIRLHLSQANSYITCLLAQNPRDTNAITLRGALTPIHAQFESIVKKLQRSLLHISNLSSFHKYEFVLHEWRQKAKMSSSEKEEELISDLMVDGYHAWGQIYHSLIGDIQINIPSREEHKKLSVGQAINLRSHPNEEIRKAAHDALEDTWENREEEFAQILNHIIGFRLQVYKHRGQDNILAESLMDNRIKEESLNAMWTAVSKHKEPFIQYLHTKAKLFGDTTLPSYNFWAPIGKGNQMIKYEDAVNFIIEHFNDCGTELGTFALHAFDNGWIESENRPNKAATAFCAGFPLSGESRVFMNYGERITNVLTLAHELGHAFHNDAMKTVDGFNRQYPLSIAETASTFCEQIILDGALEKARTTDEKLFILDEKLKRSVMNFMNIHSRFLFEKNVNEECKTGYVSALRLNELMQEAVDVAYKGSLENVSLRSWIWTPHYYLTKSPFYNFPYTFGYLFSLSLYAKSKEKGKEFEENYIQLLRDSGSMSTEDLVMKYLGEDITSENFWESGLKLCVKDVKEFLRLAST